MRVLFLPEVRQYFSELIETLLDKEYFSFEDTAVEYVEGLILDIERTLHLRVSKPAPPYFEKYGRGMLYAIFPKSRLTQWYVFFTQYYAEGEIIYLVRYISNNHMIAKYLFS